jgi:hypothetical protein
MKQHLLLSIALVAGACGDEASDEAPTSLADVGPYTLVVQVQGVVARSADGALRDQRNASVSVVYDSIAFREAHGGDCPRLDDLRAGPGGVSLELRSPGGQGDDGACIYPDLASLDSEELGADPRVVVEDDSASASVVLGEAAGYRSIGPGAPAEPIYAAGQTIDLAYSPADELEPDTYYAARFSGPGGLLDPLWQADAVSDPASGTLRLAIPDDAQPATGHIYLIGRNASTEVACDAPVGCRVDEGVDFSLEATVQ